MSNHLVRTGLAALVLTLGPDIANAEPPTFAAPEAALEALRAALLADDTKAVIALFGAEHEAELIGADPAAARQSLDAASDAAAQGMGLERGDDDDHRVIVMGTRDWPFPIPLIRTDRGWRFDIEAGIEEIIDRRIGDNELTAIANVRAFGDAQLDYAANDHDADQVLEYAQKLVSTAGQRDGLYWDDPTGSDPSPLGPLAASEADYTRYREAGDSFHGYNYRILTTQGADVPGGAYDYVINGNMIAGFALLAWPADYGNSGIMTFVTNQQGKLLQKDLGAKTAEVAAAMTGYEPDETWAEVED